MPDFEVSDGKRIVLNYLLNDSYPTDMCVLYPKQSANEYQSNNHHTESVPPRTL